MSGSRGRWLRDGGGGWELCARMTPAELQEAAVRYALEAYTKADISAEWPADVLPLFEQHLHERMAQLAQAAAPDLEIAARVHRASILLAESSAPQEERERDAFNTDAGERCEPSRHVWMPGRRKPWE